MPATRLTTLLALLACGGIASAADGVPNFVIFLADDLGYADVSCYGGTTRTPYIDRLAQEGMRLTDFHSNGVNCSPSRCALVTGRYPARAGINGIINWNSDHGLKTGEYTFAMALKTLGYTNAVFGKWHLGGIPESNPLNFGFDEFIGQLGGSIHYFTHRESENGGNKVDWHQGFQTLDEKGYSTTLIADHAIDFIKRNASKPFCLYVPFNAVHTPILDPKTGDKSKTPETYALVVQELDKAVGRVVEALDQAQLSEHTLVFFTSDNGAHENTPSDSNKPLSGGKGTVWEGGHRVACVARWPGHIPAGKTTDQTVMIMDLMPTILELAGVSQPAPHPLDGISLVPLLLRQQPLPARPLFWAHSGGWAMREGPWKLLIEGSETHLFKLDEDLSEKHDLAQQQPERVQTMRVALEAWYQEVGGEKIVGKSKAKRSKKEEE